MSINLPLLAMALLATGASARFVTSETIAGEPVATDASTGIIWQIVPSGLLLNWQQALARCESLDYAGASDWRLPDERELFSLVNFARVNPASDFPQLAALAFWSSTSDTSSSGLAWNVDFASGDVSSTSKESMLSVQCVRIGM